MKYFLRLKDLDNILLKEVDYSIIMSEVLGYKKRGFIGRKKRFAKAFKQAHHLIQRHREINPKEVEVSEECKVLFPQNVDHISYRAMMEVIHKMNTADTSSMGELIADIISATCYSSNYEGDYDNSKKEFKEFREYVLEQPLIFMLGLYNHIDSSIRLSNDTWAKRFFSVEVPDEDYDKAGGEAMSQFNIINTIKRVCNDFNYSYDQAWQMSYTLVQTNSYSHATYNHVQHKMAQLKEAKMKAQRAAQS